MQCYIEISEEERERDKREGQWAQVVVGYKVVFVYWFDWWNKQGITLFNGTVDMSQLIVWSCAFKSLIQMIVIMV